MKITTKYHGPTNTKGSRISATVENGKRIYMAYDYELSEVQNHDKALKLAQFKFSSPGKVSILESTKTGYIYQVQ